MKYYLHLGVSFFRFIQNHLSFSVEKLFKACKNDPLRILAQSVKVLRFPNGTLF